MARITRKQREDAIEECLCRADHWTCAPDMRDAPYGDALADKAGSAAQRALYDAGIPTPPADFYLEAAALLRDGWSPGDPVYLLRDRP